MMVEGCAKVARRSHKICDVCHSRKKSAMDVTMRRARPREVPLARPSAEQTYIPRVLLRQDEEPLRGAGKRRLRWLPNEKIPGASKHLQGGIAAPRPRVEPQATVSELDVERLERVDDELSRLEEEMDGFVRDFYVAAATFSAQAHSQRLLVKSIRDKRVHP